MEIRLGTKQDLLEIATLYDEVTAYLQQNINYPGWKKGIYPTYNEALSGVSKQELYVALYQGKIVGCVTLNHQQEDNYQQGNWSIIAKANEVYVIHTLAIHPDYQGLKIAKNLLEYCHQRAIEKNIKTIRLDVRAGNIPAIKLYERLGYTYAGKISLDFRGDDLGKFELYEKVL